MPVFNPWNTFSGPGASAYGSAAQAGAASQGNMLNAQVASEGNNLNFLSNQHATNANRLSAWERNFLDHDLGLKRNETDRYNIDTGRSNILSQLATQESLGRMNDATNRFGVQSQYDASLFGDLADLAGSRYGADRGAQAALGSAALSAQSNMLAPMLEQQRFMSLAPHVLGALGSLGRGGSNLSQAIMGAQ